MAFLASQADTLNKIIADAVESNSTPGIVFGAANVDGETYFAHAGARLPEDPSAGPLDEDSVFWICSSTKMITAVAALQLLERGKITLDTLVADILPEIGEPVIADFSKEGQPSIRPAKTPITFKHLLNHTSGLTYTNVLGDPSQGLTAPYTLPHDKLDPIGHFLNKLKGDRAGLPLKFEPGTDFSYGFSCDLVGFIVERVSGQSLEEYFKEHIFKPLGIKSISFYRTPDLEARRASFQYREQDRKVVPFNDRLVVMEQNPEKVSVHLGGVGAYASMRDYLKLCQHLLQIAAGRATNPILTQESVQALFEPTLPEAGVKSITAFSGIPGQWSLGLCVTTTDWPGMRKKGSAYWGGWTNTHHFLDPVSGVALVLGTQIVPTFDAEVGKVWMELEKAVYAGLEA